MCVRNDADPWLDGVPEQRTISRILTEPEANHVPTRQGDTEGGGLERRFDGQSYLVANRVTEPPKVHSTPATWVKSITLWMRVRSPSSK